MATYSGPSRSPGQTLSERVTSSSWPAASSQALVFALRQISFGCPYLCSGRTPGADLLQYPRSSPTALSLSQLHPCNLALTCWLKSSPPPLPMPTLYALPPTLPLALSVSPRASPLPLFSPPSETRPGPVAQEARSGQRATATRHAQISESARRGDVCRRGGGRSPPPFQPPPNGGSE